MNYGTDPEFFTVDKQNNVISPALLEINGIITPVIDNIKHPIYIDNADFSWMMDGVAWELTLKAPAKNAKEIHEITEFGLESLEDFISKISWNSDKLSLYKKPVVSINPDIYLPMIDVDKVFQGFIFGCDPDEDGILPDYICEELDVVSHPYRYGGGHIHFSGNDLMYENPRISVQLLAITVGNYVTLNSIYHEEEKLRVKTYGRPGRFRPQVYKDGSVGIEYRTPSNSWISFSLDKKEELFSLSELVSKIIAEPKKCRDFIKTYLPSTIEAINSADKDLSEKILRSIQ